MRSPIVGFGRSIATASWNGSLPRFVAKTLPRFLRRCLSGVRRPLRRSEHEVLFYFGGTAPSRRRCGGRR